MSVMMTTAFQKEASLLQEHVLGALYETPDGRRYRYARVAATPLLTPGSLVQSRLVDNQWGLEGLTLQTPATRGATRLVLNNPGLTPPVAANTLAGGILVVAHGTGAGMSYQIDGHTAVSSTPGSTFTVSLVADDPLVTNLDGGITLATSPYAGVNLFVADSMYSPPLGVTITPMPAFSYAWLQTWGPGVCLAGAAIARGVAVYPTGPQVTATFATHASVGVGMNTGTVNWGFPVFLTIG